MILTPDQRLRVFVSSTLAELEDERRAVRRGIEALHLGKELPLDEVLGEARALG